MNHNPLIDPQPGDVVEGIRNGRAITRRVVKIYYQDLHVESSGCPGRVVITGIKAWRRWNEKYMAKPVEKM
jgi:hypothetical protein